VTGSAVHSATASAGGDAAGPRHVAIIMDGNGRWAKRRLMPRIAGHRAGMEAVRRTITAAGEMGLEALTLYAFSSENWRRPADEVRDLMGLLRFYLRRELDELDRKGVRLSFIGDLSRFEPDLVAELVAARERTARNSGLRVILALNYGAQDELIRVARQLAIEVASGNLEVDQIDAGAIESRLDTADLPALDLVIRTSGEVRLSNFLLWQAAYAELMFVDTLWPDFGRQELAAAVAAFGQRDRRFGGR